MHPIEYASTLIVGAALVVAGYVFCAWVPWSIGLALVILPVMGVPQWLNSIGREPSRRASGE